MFWTKVDKTEDCWHWTAGKSHGYGRFGSKRYGCRKGQTTMAHRIAYELLVGPIPEGMTLDHLCRDRGCCNPDHLEPVTLRENILRGGGFAAQHAAKTHCPQGHPYSGGNLLIEDGHRRCRTCVRAKQKRYRDARTSVRPPRP
jgi:hypothetical protein